MLFALAMYMVVKAAEVECRGPLTRSGLMASHHHDAISPRVQVDVMRS